MKYIPVFAILIWISICLYHESSANVSKVRSRNSKACDDPTGYLNDLEPEYSAECNMHQTAKWAYATDITETTKLEYIDAKNEFLAYQAEIQKEIIDDFSDCDGSDKFVTRQLKFLRIHGPGNMAAADYQEMTKLLNKLESAYATTQVCEFNNPGNCQLYLEPDVETKLQYASDPEELEWYWTQWHDKISEVISAADFAQLVQYQNQVAEANGFTYMSELWLQSYDDGTDGWTADGFREVIKSLWSELKPLYNNLQAFVRMQLRSNDAYKDHIKRFGSLPVHLTRHISSHQWLHVDEITKPFPNVNLDATNALQADYTVHKIFEAADAFIKGLGLNGMPTEFWDNSTFERPSGKDVICDASAEDMCSGTDNKDFRLRMCANVTMEDLLRASKYTGYIEYFSQYTNLNYAFRRGANPAFFEGLANTFAMATSTPEHLQCKLKLDLELDIDCPLEKSRKPASVAATEIDINYLYRAALEKFPMFPFALSMDVWRSEVFEGKITQEQYNDRWYELRREYQGVIPPAQRLSTSFDPAGTHGVISEEDEYMKNFVGNILQFQFYEALCIEAGEYDPNDPESKPLHQCDFSDNLDAGLRIGNIMSHGFNTSWPDLLELATGNRALSVQPMKTYFQPLFDEIDERLTAAGDLTCFGKECQSVAREYVFHEYEIEASIQCNNATIASWNYATDLTNPEAEEADTQASLRYSKFLFREWKEKISQFDVELFDESDEKRQLKFLNAVGTSALEPAKLEQYNKLLSDMSKVYGTAKVCPYDNRDCDVETEGLNLEPGLEDIMANSRNYNELAYVWRSWRDATGKKMRDNYNQYLDLSNEAAHENGYDNMGDFWILRYESDTFKQDMETVYKTVEEIYKELHAYVRFRLSETYPQIEINNEPIPAHVLGNMWSQTWGNIYSLVLPYKDAPVFDVTDRLKEFFSDDLDGIRKLFAIANGFFVQTELADMSMAYGPKAMIIKPVGREVICHASAWDFCDGQDFRIKQCTNVNMEDFITVHHELGHIQYDLQYKHLNITFREGANPGFHEAIGDVISLSVATPKHMFMIGLMDEPVVTPESTINYLMKMALDKIAFLPFGFLIDSYRWRVFDGQIPRENLTYNWLKMRSDFQGIRPPFKRNETDFDAGAKYHVPADVPYIRYFVSYILQFQLHKELCTLADQYDPTNPAKPLHNCDIYRNRIAGQKFKEILQAGASKNWQDLLEEVTGERNLQAGPLLEYFEPLIVFLRAQRLEHEYPIDWDRDFFEKYYGTGDNDPTSPYPTPEPPATTPMPTTSATDSASSKEPGTGPTDEPVPTTTGPTDEPVSTTAAGQTGSPTVAPTNPPLTGSTEKPKDPTSTPEAESLKDDDGINTAALVIGVVLAVVVVVVVVGWFVTTKLRKPA